MEPISPPPVKKRKSEKSEKTSPGSLSPVSEEEHYTTTQLKVKKVSNQIRSVQTRTQFFFYRWNMRCFLLKLKFYLYFSQKKETKNKEHLKMKVPLLKILIVYRHHRLLHQIHRLDGKVKNRLQEEPLQPRKANFQKTNWNRNEFDY